MAYYWITAAVILFVAELFLGTVYLLVLSAALLGAALSAWLFGNTAAMWTAIVLSLAGCAWVYRFKRANLPYTPTPEDDFDIGQTVVLEELLPTGEWKIHYRGTWWHAKSVSGSLKTGDTAQIIARDGNQFIIQSFSQPIYLKG